MCGTEAAVLKVQIHQSTPIPLNVVFNCDEGELLALTGPSGSGKTTVLRAIAGLHSPAEAHISCKNSVWHDTQSGIDLAPQKRRVGFVFQHYALFPHLSAVDNITAAMLHLPAASRVERGSELLALTNMEGLETRKPHELSGGQRQRVALARALARDPDVLLLDEPFSAVDQLTRRRLYRELAQLRGALKLPMIMVTHDMSEVQQLADTLCLIHRGDTLQTGPVNDVLQRPRNATCARLLGHQNLFKGFVEKNDSSGSRVRTLGISMECSANEVPAGTSVDVLIPPAAVVMHRHDRPSRGERENPITGKLTEAVVLGDELSVLLVVETSQEPLAFRLSRHVAARNRIEVGATISVSILAEGIHLMPVG